MRQKTAVLPLYHYQQLLLELICFVLNCLLVLLLQYVMCVKAVDPAQAAGAPRRAAWVEAGPSLLILALTSLLDPCLVAHRASS